MDKTTILKIFLEHGVQADYSALDILIQHPDLVEAILKKTIKDLPSVITSEFLNTFLPTNQTETISMQHLSKIMQDRYEFIKTILMQKEELTNLISVNKITDKTKEFSIIGAVFEKDCELQLEDSTGRTDFKIDKELVKYIVEDEVIGLVCERINGVNRVKQVVYPDIPLKKEHNHSGTQSKYLFISDIHMDSLNEKYYKNLLDWLSTQKELTIIVLGGISTKPDDSTRFQSDVKVPVSLYTESDIMAPLTQNTDGTSLLVVYDTFLQKYENLWKTQPDTTLIYLLKKRNLNPMLAHDSYSNSYLIKNIPDILAVGGTGIPSATNYKGTTILTTGSFLTKPIYWLIDLQTREILKIDFS